jgi:hypothetical protein
VTYRLAIRQFRMAKASQYLERFMSKEMMDARTVVDQFCGKDIHDMIGSLRADNCREELGQIRMFANFFQELGIAFRKGLVDRRYTEEIFDFLVKSYWKKLYGWVQDYRKLQGDKSLYSKWEDLATIFENHSLESKR